MQTPLIPTEQTLHNYKQCQTHSYPALSAPQSHRERHSLADSLETDSVCTQISHLRRGLCPWPRRVCTEHPAKAGQTWQEALIHSHSEIKEGRGSDTKYDQWRCYWFFFLSLLKAEPGSVCWSEHSCVKKMYWYFCLRKKRKQITKAR